MGASIDELQGAGPGDSPGLSLYWEDDAVMAVDQRALPETYELLRLEDIDALIHAVRALAIRGAPALGLAGALGVALSTRVHRHAHTDAVDEDAVRADAERLAAARPTAVNLAWGVRRALAQLPYGPRAVLAEAVRMVSEDVAVNSAAASRTAELVESLVPDRPLRLLTHCNTGRLATAAVGTALGGILELARRGRVREVLVDETRPLLQGSRLTAWELAEAGVPYRICVDSAAAAAMAQGMVDCVLVGADRIAANGDTANKIGTYGLAVAAARHGVPFVVVAPESTWDHDLADGGGIVVEERDAAEVTGIGGSVVAPAHARVFNPAFDVTPSELITAIVSERRVVRPSHVHHDQRAATLRARIAGLLEAFPDHPRPGTTYQDLSALYAEPGLLHQTAGLVREHFRGTFDRVVAVESRGFLLGAVLAARSGVPLTLVRKPGKLPGVVHTVEYALEYGTDRLELRQGAIPPGDRVLCVDDVLATGGTLLAAAGLVESAQAEVAGMAVLVSLPGLRDGERLKRYDLLSLCEVKM
ncbi:S-methyl-5-thioribose-1-phosphate isomerase [Streptomyces luteolus]|uniref:Multifunctional fusion protein n=1 Tax=Streptomyces luteolus TaxID=3043615 RepID=A0ABT6SW61_9ACTN|nr:S-methyl-5-thioribose-1-phosphate isomerase [Streptomyces sp. B-S-A12]MDI3419849.1 S-methyl-5-thioribose-1-phosphate isomerase [Streptomyces sp. B-S-A12]